MILQVGATDTFHFLIFFWQFFTSFHLASVCVTNGRPGVDTRIDGFTNWLPVLFMDESRFTLSRYNRHERVGEAMENIQYDWFGGGSMMVWGGISIEECTALHRVGSNTLTVIRYRAEIHGPWQTLHRCSRSWIPPSEQGPSSCESMQGVPEEYKSWYRWDVLKVFL